MVQVSDLAPALAQLSAAVDAAATELSADAHNAADLEAALNTITAMTAKLNAFASPPAATPEATPAAQPASTGT